MTKYSCLNTIRIPPRNYGLSWRGHCCRINHSYRFCQICQTYCRIKYPDQSSTRIDFARFLCHRANFAPYWAEWSVNCRDRRFFAWQVLSSCFNEINATRVAIHETSELFPKFLFIQDSDKTVSLCLAIARRKNGSDMQMTLEVSISKRTIAQTPK